MQEWLPTPNDLIANVAANVIFWVGAAITGAAVAAARTWLPRLWSFKSNVPSLIGGIALGVSIGVPAAVRAWVPGLSLFEDTVLSLISGIALGILIALSGYAIFVRVTRRLVPPLQSQTAPKTFGDVAKKIRPLLDANRNVFLRFGPNSGARDAGPVRFDLTLWEKAKIDIIVPNNDQVDSLLVQYRDTIPAHDLPTVEKMKAHIYAFREHVKNPYFDYSEHQFPQAFRDLIDSSVFVAEVSDWLTGRLTRSGLPIAEAMLFGSILRNRASPVETWISSFALSRSTNVIFPATHSGCRSSRPSSNRYSKKNYTSLNSC